MDNPGDAKYGMTKEQLFKAYTELRDAGAKKFGLHSFLASNTVTNDYYPTLAKILFEVAVELKEKTGIELSYINLSGGVGIPYTPDKEGNDILKIGEGVHKVFDEVLVLPDLAISACSQSLAVSCLPLMDTLLQRQSTRSISTRSTSAWMPVR